MRIFLTAAAVMMLAVSSFGQAPKGPEQGPPPKNLTKQPDGHVSANAIPANPEKFETHIVLAGDTLSQIAGSAMKDSRLWPQLWEMNEHIVNPHWIYPNDKVLIRSITKITDATPPAAAPSPAPSPAVVQVIPPPPPPPAVPASRGIAAIKNLIAPSSTVTKARDVFDVPAQRQTPEIKISDMYCSGFIRSTPVPNTLKVASTYDRSGALLSTDSQYVHVSSGTRGGVTAGSIFQVIRPSKKVHDSTRAGAAGSLGTHYLDIGQVQIVQAQENSALAKVIGLCDAVEVGDVLLPFAHFDVPELPLNRSFSPTMTTSGKAKGSLVFMKNLVVSTGSTYRTNTAFSNEGSIAAEGGIVYINLGKGDGLKSGDLFIVYQGKTAIGEIAVLRVDEKSSSALVTYSTDVFALGDRVEQR